MFYCSKFYRQFRSCLFCSKSLFFTILGEFEEHKDTKKLITSVIPPRSPLRLRHGPAGPSTRPLPLVAPFNIQTKTGTFNPELSGTESIIAQIWLGPDPII